jgi:hypothetical protein
MKQVILNKAVLNVDGSQVHHSIPNIYPGTQVSKEPVTIARVLLRVLPNTRTTTDEETELVYGLLEKAHLASLTDEPLNQDVSEEEFQVIKQVISKEAMIVKYHFIKMVEELNT